MKCLLCQVDSNPAQFIKGFCQSCNILRQSMDMHEDYMYHAGALEELLEYYKVRSEIVRAKVKFVKEQDGY